MMIVDLPSFKSYFEGEEGTMRGPVSSGAQRNQKDWLAVLGESLKTQIECASPCVEIYGALGMVDFVETDNNLRDLMMGVAKT
jgi:hypothetical protein